MTDFYDQTEFNRLIQEDVHRLRRLLRTLIASTCRQRPTQMEQDARMCAWGSVLVNEAVHVISSTSDESVNDTARKAQAVDDVVEAIQKHFPIVRGSVQVLPPSN